MRRSLAPVAAALGAAAILALPSAALAADGQKAANAVCTTTLPPGTYANVTVPANGDCTLDEVTVLGNVTVDYDANLYLSGYTPGSGTIDGNLLVGSQADSFEDEGWVIDGSSAANGASDVTFDGTSHAIAVNNTEDLDLYDATVDGSIAAEAVGYSDVYGSTLQGSFLANQSDGGYLFGNTISGNAVVNDSPAAGDGSWTITGPQQIDGNVLVTNNQVSTDVDTNQIGQNLVCTGNNPPTVNFANQVGGRSIGQCATPTDPSDS